jgi:hypothetical protein
MLNGSKNALLAKLIIPTCYDEKKGFEMFFKFLRDQVKEAVTA